VANSSTSLSSRRDDVALRVAEDVLGPRFDRRQRAGRQLRASLAIVGIHRDAEGIVEVEEHGARSTARRDRTAQRGALAEAYELFPPLASRRHLAAFSLSGGERQMLSVGRALVARPRVLLLDEPSLGLARRALSQIMARIKTLVVERGLTVLLIEQNAKSALSVADEAVVLHLGKVVAQGRAEQLVNQEGLRHAYLGF